MFRRMRNRDRAVRRIDDILAPNQAATLAQAEGLIRQNQSAQAAPLFAELARELENSQHPRMAANLHAQAAHAYANASDSQGALSHARSALTLFIQYQMIQRTSVFYGNIVRKLNAKNMQAAANTLQQEFGGRLGPVPAVAPAPAASTARPGRLPSNCPKCGAPVHGSANAGDELECDYCGTPIRAED